MGGGARPPPPELPMRLSDPAVAAFIVIPVVLVVVFVWGTRRAWQHGGATPAAASRMAIIVGVLAVAWMAAAWAAAASGVLRDWDRTPPPIFFLVVSIVALAGAIAFSGLGRRLAAFIPLWALVGVQAFRLPLEVAMHTMYERGIMPEEMTYTGRNFDIVTGATAVVVAAMLVTGRAGRGLVMLWNVMGLALLMNVVTVAILATPRFRYFGSERLNTWVTYPPFVWLPAVMVLAALAGHLVIFRALQMQQR
jgi:hypothetical protein